MVLNSKPKFVRFQVIQDDPDNLRFRMDLIHQPLQSVGKVLHRMSLGELDMPLTDLGFKAQVQISHAVALIFIVVTFYLSWLRWQTGPSFFDQLLEPFIKTNQWAFGIIGLFIQVEHTFHASHVFGAGFRDAPHALLPGLQFVFLSVKRTVSCEILSTIPSSTNLPASNHTVQWSCPACAWLQAMEINWASPRQGSKEAALFASNSNIYVDSSRTLLTH